MLTTINEYHRHHHTLDDDTIKQAVSEVVDLPPEEWVSERVQRSFTSSADATCDENSKKNRSSFGICLYVATCHKYGITPTDSNGVKFKDTLAERILNRAWKLTYNINYRELFFKPLTYKLHTLTKEL